VLAAARALGAVDVAMTDRVPERIALARARGGAAWSGTPEALNAAVTAGAAGPFDIVIECCGRQEALDQALELLRPGGQLLIVGIPSERRVSFNVDVMRRKEIAIQNVRRQNHCVGPALELIARNQIDVTYMITHRFALEQTQEAFDTVAAYRDGVLKAMVHIA
jgi:threonine dehydrogenase-like Zn-dependent dehydrogenase